MNRKQYLDYQNRTEKEYLEKRYSNTNETILVEKEVVSKYRTKTKKSKIEISTKTTSSNHKLVQISELYFDSYDYEYKHTKKNITIPIKDFKNIVKQLNDILTN